jgi:hypothetical protein
MRSRGVTGSSGLRQQRCSPPTKSVSNAVPPTCARTHQRAVTLPLSAELIRARQVRLCRRERNERAVLTAVRLQTKHILERVCAPAVVEHLRRCSEGLDRRSNIDRLVVRRVIARS